MMAHLIVTGPNVVYSNLNKKYPENQINHSGFKKKPSEKDRITSKNHERKILF